MSTNSSRQRNTRTTVPEDPKSARIAELNDLLRIQYDSGSLMITAGIRNLGDFAVFMILHKVRAFSDFTPDNDPYGEHDFGRFKQDGQGIMWKIDYYDRAMEFGSPDPADPELTTRVLTIMLDEEY